MERYFDCVLGEVLDEVGDFSWSQELGLKSQAIGNVFLHAWCRRGKKAIASYR